MENKSQEAPVNTMTAAFKKWQRSIAAINSEFEIWQAGAEWAFKSVPKSVQVEGLREALEDLCNEYRATVTDYFKDHYGFEWDENNKDFKSYQAARKLLGAVTGSQEGVYFTPIKRHCVDECDWPDCTKIECVSKLVSPHQEGPKGEEKK